MEKYRKEDCIKYLGKRAIIQSLKMKKTEDGCSEGYNCVVIGIVENVYDSFMVTIANKDRFLINYKEIVYIQEIK